MTLSEEPARDPARDLLVYWDYQGQRKRAIPLDEFGADIDRSMAATRESYDNDFQSGVVAISPARAMVMASLLRELAIRLRPGTDIGPIETEGGLSRTAADLAAFLHGERTRSADGYE